MFPEGRVPVAITGIPEAKSPTDDISISYGLLLPFPSFVTEKVTESVPTLTTAAEDKTGQDASKDQDG